MSLKRFFQELAWPVTDMVVLLAIVAFSLLMTLSQAADLDAALDAAVRLHRDDLASALEQ
jgi:hypothetical protein